ncbi:MAG: hypothetical protein ACYTDU_15640, partial [Planctomycetota bacterium]
MHPLVWRLLEKDRDPLPVWVFFTDKGLDTESRYRAAFAAAETRLSPRALERRRLRRAVPDLVDERDVDLCATYV